MLGIILDAVCNKRVQILFGCKALPFAHDPVRLAGKLVKGLIPDDILVDPRRIHFVHYLFANGRFPVFPVVRTYRTRKDHVKACGFIDLIIFLGRKTELSRLTVDIVPLLVARRRVCVSAEERLFALIIFFKHSLYPFNPPAVIFVIMRFCVQA